MKYTREDLPKSQIKFTFEVKGEKWSEALTKAYDKVKHNYQVEGFRKGKVPKKVIEQKYGIGVFFEDATDIILPEAYGFMLDKETEVIPVARPDVSLIAISDTEIKFSITITVKPEIELGAYTGLEIKKINKTVSDDEVMATIKQAQEGAGSWEEIAGRVVANGDTVNLDYSGSVDGVKFEGGTAEDQTLVIGSGQFIPGFEEQLVGLNIGDEKDITVTFPKEYGAEKLAGKDAVFAIKIRGIKVKIVPELDDEFAQDVSEFNTYVEYKEDITKNLQKAKDEQNDNEMTNSLIDAIIEGSKMDIPEPMVESQIDEMINEFEQRLQYQGMKMEDYLKYTGSDMKAMREQYKETADKNVKIRLVLDAIVSNEKFDVSDAEVDAKIAQMADEVKKDVEEYKKSVNEEMIEYLRNVVVSDKLISFLKDKNTFVD